MTTWVVLAGLPGTGKSTLARALALRMPLAILDKDRVRAALFPGQLTDYSTGQDDVCLQAMQHAAAWLTVRQSVGWILFDGRTFSTARQIQDVVEAADQSGASWRILHLTCEDEVAEKRLSRGDTEHPARNRTPELYRAIQRRFEPLVHPHLRVDTTGGVEGQLARVESYLRLPVLRRLR